MKVLVLLPRSGKEFAKEAKYSHATTRSLELDFTLSPQLAMRLVMELRLPQLQQGTL